MYDIRKKSVPFPVTVDDNVSAPDTSRAGWYVSQVGSDGLPTYYENVRSYPFEVGKRYHFEYRPQAYLDALEKFKNDPDALQRLEGGIRSFDDTFQTWDSVTRAFRGAMNSDALMTEYAKNYDQYLSDLLNELANRDYNSESAKAQRLNNAGIPADLNGIGDASSMAGVEPDVTPPDTQALYSPGRSGGSFPFIDNARNIGQGLFQVIGNVFGYMRQAQDIELGEENIYAAQFGNNIATQDELQNSLAAAFPSEFREPISRKNADGTDMSDEEYQDALDKRQTDISAWLYEFMQSHKSLFSKRFQKRFDSFRLSSGDSDSMGVKYLLSNLDNIMTGNDQSTIRMKGNSLYDRRFARMVSSFADKYSSYQDSIIDLDLQCQKAGLTIEMLENAYNDDYWRELNKVNPDSGLTGGSLAAHAQNLQNLAQLYTKKYDAEENKLWSSTLASCPDNFWGAIAKIGLMALRAQVSQGFHPSVSSSSSYRRGRGASSWSNGQGQSRHIDNAGSSSFSLHW